LKVEGSSNRFWALGVGLLSPVSCLLYSVYRLPPVAGDALRLSPPATSPASSPETILLDQLTPAVARESGGNDVPIPLPYRLIHLAGQQYAHGLALGSPALVSYALNGQASRLEVLVGADDSSSADAALTFHVWLDGRRVAATGPQRAGDAPLRLDINLAGAQRLLLTATPSGAGAPRCQANWADARITLLPDSAPGTVALATVPEVMLQLGHRDPVNSLAFSPDSARLVTGSNDGSVRIWDTQTGDLLNVVEGNLGEVRAVAFSPNGRRLAVGHKGRVSMWDAGGHSRVWQHWNEQSIPALAFTPDGNLLVGVNFFLSSNKGQPYLRNAETAATSEVGAAVTALSVVACASTGQLAWAGEEGIVRLYDPGTSRHLVAGQGQGHSGAVLGMAFSPDGTILATSSRDRRVLLWDTASGELLRPIRPRSKDVYAVAFSPDGRTLATTSDLPDAEDNSGQIRFWDPLTGEPRGELRVPNGPLRCIAYSPDGRRLAVGCRDGSVRFWEVPSRKAAFGIPGDPAGLAAATISPDGTTAATGGWDGAVRFWSLADGSLQRSLPVHASEVMALAYSPDGRFLACGSAGALGKMKLVDMKTVGHVGEILAEVPGHIGPVRSLSFSRDGRWLAGAAMSDVYLYDGVTGALRHNFSVVKRETLVGSVAFTPAGRGLAVGGRDGSLRVWDPHSQRVLQTLLEKGRPIHAVAFAPSGHLMAAGSEEGEISLWRTNGQAAVIGPPSVLSSHGIGVLSLAFSPGGDRLYSGHSDGLTRCWDTPTGEMIGLLSEHRDGVTAVAVTRDGRRVVTTGRDRVTRIWGGENPRLLASLVTVPSAATDTAIASEPWLAITPFGFYTMGGDADRLVKWRWPTGQMASFGDWEHSYRNPKIVVRSLAGQPIREKPMTRFAIHPRCRITSVTLPAGPQSGEAVVDLSVTDDGGIRRTHVYLDGIRIPDALVSTEISPSQPLAPEDRGARSMVPADDHRVGQHIRLKFALPPGEERVHLSVVVEDAETHKGGSDRDILRPGVPPVLGTLHLLAIGVRDYRARGLDLRFADRDAYALAATLSNQKGRAYSRVKPAVLTNSKATRPAILAALRKLQSAGPGDTVMVLLSGHGVTHRGGFHFACHELDPRTPATLSATSVSLDEILGLMTKVAARKLLLIDACHSGTSLGAKAARGSALEPTDTDTGIIIFTSSSGDQYSYEEPFLRLGSFTAALVDAFEGRIGRADDGRLRLGEMVSAVSQRVRERSLGIQTPVLLFRDMKSQLTLARHGP